MNDKYTNTDEKYSDTWRDVIRGPDASSRRRFIATSALLGAGALGVSMPAAAGGDEDDDRRSPGDQDQGGGGGVEAGEDQERDGQGEPPEEVEQQDVSDVDILNFALTLEYLEARFYREGLNTISDTQLRRSEPLQEVGGIAQGRAPAYLRVIQEHEETHVQALVDTIESLGGEPIPEPEFEFGTATEDPAEFLATAAALETTGVSAYAGAAPLIDNEDLIPPALSIHSVEARHSSFLNLLNAEIPFPDAFDEPLSMDEVLERAGPFIVE